MARVKAIYEYNSQEPDDLSFSIGQIITITEQIDADWYEGEYTDATGSKRSGIFPNNFVEKYEPEIPSRPTRPTRQKEPEADAQREVQEEKPAPPLPVASKPQPPPVAIPAAAVPSAQDTVRSPASASSQRTPIAREEPPPVSKPTPAQPVASESKKAPPPVAQKTNAFKDRIAAFNASSAAPPLPFKPKTDINYIRKPFVAPPPSSNSYVPPIFKQEPVQKPYIREEDPEIKQRREDDLAAAEAAGFSTEAQATQGEDDEDAPKPQSLKERIAALQKQQAEQRGEKKPKKAPVQRPSEPALEDDYDVVEYTQEPMDQRKSLDAPRERPRIPSSQQPLDPATSVPPMPQHEILSGGEEADQSAAGETEDDTTTLGPEDSDEKPVPPRRASTAPRSEHAVADEEEATEVADSDEDDSVDEETRRKEELRQRMAKMSGGMGMPGMFGGGMPMGGLPKPPKTAPSSRKKGSGTSEDHNASIERQPRMPLVPIPIPGMQREQSPESQPAQRQPGHRPEDADTSTSGGYANQGPGEGDEQSDRPSRTSATQERGVAPPVPRERPASQILERAQAQFVPSERPVPAPPTSNNAAESRPVPQPPPVAPILSPGPGSESDDESSVRAPQSPAGTPVADNLIPARSRAPPVPGQRDVPSLQMQSPTNKRASYFGSESSFAGAAAVDKRVSRVPTIPTDIPISSPRPPPPPPPSVAPPTRQNTNLQPGIIADDSGGESDYEGDYDTDIASGATHKAALTSHGREASLDDSTTGGETPVTSPVIAAQPPLPTQRAVPPPPPQASQKSGGDLPRGPPPLPPPRDLPGIPVEGDDYDPYRYAGMDRAIPPVPIGASIAAPPVPSREPAPIHDDSSDDMYSASPPRRSMERPPPPPPREPEQDDRVPFMPVTPRAPPPAREAPRQSLDVQRAPVVGRRSMDQSRPAEGREHIAGDLDLSESAVWWTAPQPLPPALQPRNGVDILSESEESTTSKRGGRTTISKDIYILYLDYSQTVITVRYDSREPTDASLEQRHEPPPTKLRQDQLEHYHSRFGARIAETAASLGSSKKDTLIGDGSPAALPSELIKSHPEALHPIGSRAFGALVYANLANASIQQHDEIRPGDIITFRNCKFEGKHSGPIHAKYKQDLGTGHVAVVGEWDGTRKKVRVWEQGAGKVKGVKGESYRLGDLKSGEVKVWRVVGREWVGWEGES